MLLVVIEHDRGSVPVAAAEAITAGRRLGDSLGLQVGALAIGAGADLASPVAGEHGVGSVHVATHELLTDYGPEAWGATIAQVVREVGATVVVSVGTDVGNEIIAHAAVRLGEPFVANCVTVSPDWSLTRIRWGGSLLEEATLEASVRLLTFAHHAVEPEPAAVPATITTFTPTLTAEDVRTIVFDRVVQEAGVTLSTAPVVVGGGRGVGSAEGFAVLDDLAGLLGGRVGCSRVATNNGWRPHGDQVGQTGTKIAPEIYIACGISGAIQHWIGAAASKRILAINTDKDANMVAKADYAVIGDLHEVVPAIAEEIRRRRG